MRKKEVHGKDGVVAMPQLPIAEMATRHSGLTEAIAEGYLEAARVCLDRHHTSPTSFQLRESQREQEAEIHWSPADERVRGAWANETDTTEAGAYACVLAAVEVMEGLVALRRAEILTGADYYVGPSGTDPDDLEGCLRLEVSGTDQGTSATVASRLGEKVEQAANGASNLPALAGVVGFKARLVMLQRVDGT